MSELSRSRGSERYGVCDDEEVAAWMVYSKR